MSKKQNVSEYFDNIMGGSEAPKVSNEPEAAASQQPEKRGKGRPREDGYESRTFRVKTEHVQKLKLIALKEGRLQKDILDFALESIISRYEEKHKYEVRSICSTVDSRSFPSLLHQETRTPLEKP